MQAIWATALLTRNARHRIASVQSTHSTRVRERGIPVTLRIIDPALNRRTRPTTSAAAQVHGRGKLSSSNSSVHGGATQCGDAYHIGHAKERGSTDSLWTKFAMIDMVFEMHGRSFMGAVLSSCARAFRRSISSLEEPGEK